MKNEDLKRKIAFVQKQIAWTEARLNKGLIEDLNSGMDYQLAKLLGEYRNELKLLVEEYYRN